MMRRLAAALLALVLLGSAGPASASTSTEVIQGRVLRLVSVADWDAAGALLPGQQVHWDVAVSADAPDPGTVVIGVSASGDAPLVVDASMCGQEWQRGECPGGAVALRSAWSIPRDGVEVNLAEMADTDVAHLRLTITLGADGAGAGATAGSTDVRVHARGDGETVAIGPDGPLATTGLTPIAPWITAGGTALVVFGLTLVALRRRGSRGRMLQGDVESATGGRP